MVRFNKTEGFVGAFPTFDDHKRMTLRPVSDQSWLFSHADFVDE